MKIENNHFQDSRDIIGTFYSTARGTWEVAGNSEDGVTWSRARDDYFPAGPNVTSTTTVSIPYTYRMDPASCVADLVGRTAGAGRGLQVSDGNCTPTSGS